MIWYQVRKQCIQLVRIVALYARIQEQLDTLGVSLLHCHQDPKRAGPIYLMEFVTRSQKHFQVLAVSVQHSHQQRKGIIVLGRLNHICALSQQQLHALAVSTIGCHRKQKR
jgi:hypothetical protein